MLLQLVNATTASNSENRRFARPQHQPHFLLQITMDGVPQGGTCPAHTGVLFLLNAFIFIATL